MLRQKYIPISCFLDVAAKAHPHFMLLGCCGKSTSPFHASWMLQEGGLSGTKLLGDNCVHSCKCKQSVRHANLVGGVRKGEEKQFCKAV
ncbi:hypothetical protein POVWA2_060620 [Plasmodium ovale wallikeri]|uniref:Uncharacterized protein n=1 Tax=Plasmodium ovale wallikeri TaxID=864142 RepID=A0A1A9A2E5_PLAOA|nr:hypothetical protein POVWA2_060620 [Plasmodium ovale wallikeri]